MNGAVALQALRKRGMSTKEANIMLKIAKMLGVEFKDGERVEMAS